MYTHNGYSYGDMIAHGITKLPCYMVYTCSVPAGAGPRAPRGPGPGGAPLSLFNPRVGERGSAPKRVGHSPMLFSTEYICAVAAW